MGSFTNTALPKDQIDESTGEVIKKFVRRPLTAKEVEAAKNPEYEPNDHIGVQVGFVAEEPAGIVFRFVIETAPTSIDKSNQAIGMVVAARLQAPNLVSMTSEFARHLFNSDGSTINPTSTLPRIIAKSPKFKDYKNNIILVNFQASGGQPITFQNLFNEIKFEAPYTRGVDIFRKLFGQSGPIRFSLYVKDEVRSDFITALGNTIKSIRVENTVGNIYRRFYTEKLQTSRAPHHMDTGASIVDLEERPIINTAAPSSYADVFEMTTRLGVGIRQVLEDRLKSVLNLNSQPATMRVVELVGAGDLCYLGSLKPGAEYRLDTGDELKINFRIHNAIDEENWSFRVMDPFPWTLQGETVGILRRPRGAANADDKEGNFRPFQKTTLPVQRVMMNKINDARQCLSSATTIRCLIKLCDSDNSETRMIEAMNICMNGLRQSIDQEGQPAGKVHTRGREWADFMIMRDALVHGKRDLFPEPICKEYLSDLKDADHVACKEYLGNAPVTSGGLVLGMIQGVPGSGKSELAARLIVAKMLGKPSARVLVVSSANQPADVLIQKVHGAMQTALNAKPEYKSLLQKKAICRVYADVSETAYVMTLREQDEEEDDGECDSEFMEVMASVVKGPSAEGRTVTPLGDFQNEAEISQLPRLHRSGSLHITDEDSKYHQSMSRTQVMMAIRLGRRAVAPEIKEYQGSLDDAKMFLTNLSQYSTMLHYHLPYDDPFETPDKKITKKQRRRALLEETCQVYRDNMHDTDEGVCLTDSELAGTKELTIYGGLLPGGVIDIHHPKVPKAFKEFKTSMDIVNQLNTQLQPPPVGVRDKRYKVADLSIAQIAHQLLLTDKWAFLYTDIMDRIKGRLDHNRAASFKMNFRGLINEAKGTCDVAALTVNSLSEARHRDSLGDFDLVVIDEAGMMNLPEFLSIGANLKECGEIIMFGDSKQLSPQTPNITGNPGFTKELGQSVMTYLEKNYWPSATVNLNRRGAPFINVIPSVLHYQGSIKDAPCTRLPWAHPKTAEYAKFFSSIFKEYHATIPSLYIDVRGHEEVRDAVTGSWINLTTASVIVSLVEKGITNKVFTAEDVPHITHYTAQIKVVKHAYARLAMEFPDHGFENIRVVSTDSIQGGQGSCPFINTVRTVKLGFTNDQGRVVVATTRAQDFQVVVDNVCRLGEGQSAKNPPYMKRAFDEARKRKVCVNVDVNNHAEFMKHRHVHGR